MLIMVDNCYVNNFPVFDSKTTKNETKPTGPVEGNFNSSAPGHKSDIGWSDWGSSHILLAALDLLEYLRLWKVSF